MGYSPWGRKELDVTERLSTAQRVKEILQYKGELDPFSKTDMHSMQETWVQSLGWEKSLEEGMATHSSILAWRIPWTEEPGGLQSMGLKRVRHD